MRKFAGHQGRTLLSLRVYLITFIYFFAITPSLAESLAPTTTKTPSAQKFIVSTNNGLVSVKATDASLKDVIQGIGQALGIEVEAHVRGDEKVTTAFRDLPLDEAIKRLSANFAYTTDKDGEKLSKLFIYPKGEAVPQRQSVMKASNKEAGQHASEVKSFKFEFDPAEFLKQGQ